MAFIIAAYFFKGKIYISKFTYFNENDIFNEITPLVNITKKSI